MGSNKAQKQQLDLQNQMLGLQMNNMQTGNELTKLQAEDYKKFRPQINELQGLSLESSLKDSKSPVWDTQRGIGESIMSGMNGMSAINASNPDVIKLQSMYDNDSANWAKNQLGMMKEDSAANRDFGSSYRASQLANLGKLLSDQKTANYRQAISDVGNQYTTNAGIFDWSMGGQVPVQQVQAPNVSNAIPQFPALMNSTSGLSGKLGTSLMGLAGSYY